MNSRVITSGDLAWIVNIMRESSVIVENRLMLVSALGIDMGTVTDIERDRDCMTNTSAFLLKAMDLWISKSSGQTLETLLCHLRTLGFNSTADAIEARQSEFPPTPTLKFEDGNSASSVWFDVPEDVHMFTGRDQDMDDLHVSITKQNLESGECANDLTVITAVCGMGGIGKTSLTIHYAWRYFKNDFYKNVIWINSETKNGMSDSFKRLAVKLGLDVSFHSDMVSGVYDYFKTTNALVIFDNVECYLDVKPYIPIRKPKTLRPYVLVSSRNREWGLRTHLIDLNVFSLEESVEYYEKYLDLTTEDELSLAKQISSELGNLPLAVKQAGAYIKIQQQENKKPVIESLEEYLGSITSKSTKALEFEHWSHTVDIYEKSVYTTWTFSMEKLRKQNKITERIIELISYLNADNIPIKLIHLISKRGLWDRIVGNIVEIYEIDAGIKLLSLFCLITIDNDLGYVSVHRLLQKVVRDRLQSKYNGSNLKWILEIMRLPLTQRIHDDGYEDICLIHALSLKEHISTVYLPSAFFAPHPPMTNIRNFYKLIDLKLYSSVDKHVNFLTNLLASDSYKEILETFNDRRKFYNTKTSRIGIPLNTLLTLKFANVIFEQILADSASYVNYDRIISRCQIVKSISHSFDILSDSLDWEKNCTEALKNSSEILFRLAIHPENGLVKNILLSTVYVILRIYYNFYKGFQEFNEILRICPMIVDCLTEMLNLQETIGFLEDLNDYLNDGFRFIAGRIEDNIVVSVKALFVQIVSKVMDKTLRNSPFKALRLILITLSRTYLSNKSIALGLYSIYRTARLNLISKCLTVIEELFERVASLLTNEDHCTLDGGACVTATDRVNESNSDTNTRNVIHDMGQVTEMYSTIYFSTGLYGCDDEWYTSMVGLIGLLEANDKYYDIVLIVKLLPSFMDRLLDVRYNMDNFIKFVDCILLCAESCRSENIKRILFEELRPVLKFLQSGSKTIPRASKYIDIATKFIFYFVEIRDKHTYSVLVREYMLYLQNTCRKVLPIDKTFDI